MWKIVVGFDSSDAAEDALRLAQAFREATAGELIVVSVEELEPYFFDAPVWQEHADAQRAHDFARAAEVLGEDGFARRTAIGSVPRALNEVADEEEADLIVVGSTHRGTVGRVMPGSVGDRLFAGAPCAVAIAPLGYHEREHLPISLIGTAYDGGPESQVALDVAIALAQSAGGELRVISVLPTLDARLRPQRIGPSAEGYRKVLHGRFERLLGDAMEGIPADVEADSVLLEGTPSRQLAGAGVELDLLVMGSRGYGPVRRTLLGGLAREVVTLAPCPVVVLPRSAARAGVGASPEPDGNPAAA